MSRSRRKTPIAGLTMAESEKRDKTRSHRAYRRRVAVLVGTDPETPLPTERQITNPWSMAKEGKKVFDPKDWPKGLRK